MAFGPDRDDDIMAKYRGGGSGPDDDIMAKYRQGGRKRGLIGTALDEANNYGERSRERSIGAVAGVGKFGGRVVEAFGKGVEGVGSLFDRDDDPRTLNVIQRSGRKFQRAGETIRDRIDTMTPNEYRDQGKMAGEMGAEIAVAATGAGAAMRALPRTAGWIAKSAAATAGAAPATATSAATGNSMSEALGLSDEDDSDAMRVAKDLALDATLGFGLDSAFRYARGLKYKKIKAVRAIRDEKLLQEELARIDAEAAAELEARREARASAVADAKVNPQRPLRGVAEAEASVENAAKDEAQRAARQAELEGTFGEPFETRESLLKGVDRFGKPPRSVEKAEDVVFRNRRLDSNPEFGDDLAPRVDEPNRAPPEVAARTREDAVESFKEPRNKKAAEPDISPEEVANRLRVAGAKGEAEREAAILLYGGVPPETVRAAYRLVRENLAGAGAGGAFAGMTSPEDATFMERAQRIAAGMLAGGLGQKTLRGTPKLGPESGAVSREMLKTMGGAAVGAAGGAGLSYATGSDMGEGAVAGALIGGGLGYRSTKPAMKGISRETGEKMVKAAGERDVAFKAAKAVEADKATPLAKFDPRNLSEDTPEAVKKIMNINFAGNADEITQRIMAGRVKDLEDVLSTTREPWSVVEKKIDARMKRGGLARLFNDSNLKASERVAAGEQQRYVIALQDKVGELGDHLLKLDEAIKAQPDNAALKAQRDAIYEQAVSMQGVADRVMATYKRGGTEAGRNLAYRRALSALNTPGSLAIRAEKELGRKLTPEELGEITRSYQEGNKLRAFEIVANLIEPTKGEQVLWLREAGMLSRLGSRVKDFLSSAANHGIEGVVNAPVRTLVDKQIAKKTGQRTSALPTSDWFVATAQGGKKGAADFAEKIGLTALREELRSGKGYEAALKAWGERVRKMDISPEDMQKFDFPKIAQIKNLTGNEAVDKALDTYVKTVFRATIGTDLIVKGAARDAAMVELGLAEAAQKGLKGADATAYMKKLLEDPTDLMKAEAEIIAEKTTFQNSGKAAAVVRGLKGGVAKTVGSEVTKLHGPEAGRAAEQIVRNTANFILPFARTAGNIASRVADYTILGGAHAAYDLWRLRKLLNTADEMTPDILREMRGLQRSSAERLGRFATGGTLTGLGIIALGAKLGEEGLMTGAYPEDASERAAFEAAGMQPNSILLFDTWVPIGQISPLGNVLAIGAGGANKSILGQLGAGAKTVLDQPLVTGTRQLLDVAQDPERDLEKFLSAGVSSFIPTFIADIAAITDKNRGRDRRGGFLDATKARIPGLRQTLPLQRDVLGRNTRSGVGPLGLISPFTGHHNRGDDPVVAELLSGGGINKPDPGDFGLDKRDREAYNARLAQEGPVVRARLARVVRDPDFRGLAQEDKDYIISRLTSDARRDVRGKRTNTRRKTPDIVQQLVREYNQ